MVRNNLFPSRPVPCSHSSNGPREQGYHASARTTHYRKSFNYTFLLQIRDDNTVINTFSKTENFHLKLVHNKPYTRLGHTTQDHPASFYRPGNRAPEFSGASVNVNRSVELSVFKGSWTYWYRLSTRKARWTPCRAQHFSLQQTIKVR